MAKKTTNHLLTEDLITALKAGINPYTGALLIALHTGILEGFKTPSQKRTAIIKTILRGKGFKSEFAELSELMEAETGPMPDCFTPYSRGFAASYHGLKWGLTKDATPIAGTIEDRSIGRKDAIKLIRDYIKAAK